MVACRQNPEPCVHPTRAYASRSRARALLGVHPHPHRHRGLSCSQGVSWGRMRQHNSTRIIGTGLPFASGLYFSRAGSTYSQRALLIADRALLTSRGLYFSIPGAFPNHECGSARETLYILGDPTSNSSRVSDSNHPSTRA